MKEYQSLIDYWSFDQFRNFCPNLKIDKEKWGDSLLSEQFLAKYWINEIELNDIQLRLLSSVFPNTDIIKPKKTYDDRFDLIFFSSFSLFVENEFNLFLRFLINIGETNFYIIQTENYGYEGLSCFRLKFPVSITWDEIISGNFISAILLDYSINNYYVFGETKKWGKFAANEAWPPVNVYGIEKPYSHDFETIFYDYIQSNQEPLRDVLDF